MRPTTEMGGYPTNQVSSYLDAYLYIRFYMRRWCGRGRLAPEEIISVGS